MLPYPKSKSGVTHFPSVKEYQKYHEECAASYESKSYYASRSEQNVDDEIEIPVIGLQSFLCYSHSQYQLVLFSSFHQKFFTGVVETGQNTLEEPTCLNTVQILFETAKANQFPLGSN